MPADLDELAPFREICRKICLNIPESSLWQWDDERNMAVIILDEEDAELVFFPLFKEFENHWNFSLQTNGADASMLEYINAKYGLMPGQAFFTSYSLCNLVLGVAWWPWGDDRKVSMRIGIIPVNRDTPTDGLAYSYLSRWLNITR